MHQKVKKVKTFEMLDAGSETGRHMDTRRKGNIKCGFLKLAKEEEEKEEGEEGISTRERRNEK